MTDFTSNNSVTNSRRMAIRGKGGKWAPTAVRLRVLRSAMFDENMSQFARRLQVSNQRLANMENGFPLSIDVANKIRAAVPGISLDWLYYGEERGLPMDMVMRLRAEAAKTEYRAPL